MTEIAPLTPPESTSLVLPGDPELAYARYNWGRWIVDCASPYCAGALALEPGTPAMQCWDCGHVTEPIAWPDSPESIETLLAMRPSPRTRSWEPGETLHDLLRENVEYGLVQPPPPRVDGAPSAHVLIRTLENPRDGRLHRLPDRVQREIEG